MMRTKRFRNGMFFLILLLIMSVTLAIGQDAIASSELAPELQRTPFPTPTPGPDGRIVYIVQQGDDFWSIAAIAGISLEELYALNGIQDSDYAIPGTELVLGFAGPAEPTTEVEAQITPTSAEPTATPIFSTGEICILLFLDGNGNARLDDGEVALSGGQISIVDVSGTVAVEAETGGNPEGQCFSDLEAGDYNVSAAVPQEYNATTSMSLPLRLAAGDIKYVQFGAQPSAAVSDQVPDRGGSGSLWLGVFGIFMLLAAGGLAYYASRYNRRSFKLRK
jgi:hypothetical protein